VEKRQFVCQILNRIFKMLKYALLEGPKLFKMPMRQQDLYLLSRSLNKCLPVIPTVFYIFMQKYFTEPVQTSTSSMSNVKTYVLI
jgi:hypothetical protein